MDRFVKTLAAIALCSAIVMPLMTGCQKKDSKQQIVGIAMPTQSSQRWIQDGGNMKKILEDRGYKVDLQYAEDNIDAQVNQLENMIVKGAHALVIASIDGESLTNVLEKAADQDIPVIAYDRLIRNSPYVSYYATFDNFLVGVQQGSYLVDKLGLKEGKGPYNIEIFAGSPDDNNAYFFFDGAMSELQPYIDNGQLVVKSGQTDFDQVATLRWDGATAQQRMDNILTAHYSDANVDAVLSPYDGISIGILSSLKSVGYGTSKPMPVVTGQDAEIPSVKSILAGEQAQTVFKDTRVLAQRAADMVDAVLQGKKAEVNDTTTYNNGVKIVPSYLEEPVSVDITNWEEALIDTGYYTKDQLQ
ncbi:multiple monosaccharide ABC transporter substrate-binding protein [Sediminispirochaeta bajacaliforniensis]|uniref:multiple monosaccharide ABC transporter substrate-binding protein n=1 Tax=Sediminispirochaeta bajacaliforniensis TaxID=148 RepID=UPI00036C5F8A|nr:multiple monosaccharide ABC transporter substrate-binding protein [Sediminispirochaeta bajacaliforniensis]